MLTSLNNKWNSVFKPLVLFFAIVSLHFLYACKEEIKPRAEITVLKEDGVALEGARVIVGCSQPKCVVADTQSTNFLGQTVHEFDLPAVLKVSVFKVSLQTIQTGFPPQTTVVGTDSLCGEEFITLKENEVSKITVVVSPCNE